MAEGSTWPTRSNEKWPKRSLHTHSCSPGGKRDWPARNIGHGEQNGRAEITRTECYRPSARSLRRKVDRLTPSRREASDRFNRSTSKREEAAARSRPGALAGGTRGASPRSRRTHRARERERFGGELQNGGGGKDYRPSARSLRRNVDRLTPSRREASDRFGRRMSKKERM